MEVQPQRSLTPSQKRPFEEDAPVSTPKNTTSVSDTENSPLTVVSSIQTPSPIKQAAIRARPPANNTTPVAASQTTPNLAPPSGTQPPKKRKLTDQEKEAKEKEKEEKRLEKEAKDKAKAEQKAQKDEEKRVKDEEKRKKNEEREEKKRAKELEQQQKEEEKRKKERSQMKLNNFFSKPKPDVKSSGLQAVDAIQNTTPTTALLAPELPVQDANSGPVSPQKAIQQRAKSDYERYFLPFQLPSHAILAPYNRYIEDPAKVAAAVSRLDQLISQEDTSMDTVDTHSLKSQFPRYEGRGSSTVPILDIMDRLNGSSDKPIDLTKEPSIKSKDPIALLKQIPMKYLHYPEDERPAYYGTYTKPYTPREAAHLARNPFDRSLRETDYDYDSEAEWEPAGEGEDLDSEGEDDLDDEGDDDMEGFLDDEGDAQVKRGLINGDLQPVSTGLCWEDSQGVSKLNDGSGAISTEFKDFKMGFLLDPYTRSIDPFSTAYWAPPPVPTALASKDSTGTGVMQPPRLPLTQRPMNSMMNSLNSAPSGTAPAAGGKPAKPPKRLIPADLIPEFKSQVEGSDLTKIALIEALKKKFPKLPKDAINNTLGAVAQRVGAKEVDKRWVLR